MQQVLGLYSYKLAISNVHYFVIDYMIFEIYLCVSTTRVIV
jgi:hypothetical protein